MSIHATEASFESVTVSDYKRRAGSVWLSDRSRGIGAATELTLGHRCMESLCVGSWRKSGVHRISICGLGIVEVRVCPRNGGTTNIFCTYPCRIGRPWECGEESVACHRHRHRSPGYAAADWCLPRKPLQLDSAHKRTNAPAHSLGSS